MVRCGGSASGIENKRAGAQLVVATPLPQILNIDGLVAVCWDFALSRTAARQRTWCVARRFVSVVLQANSRKHAVLPNPGPSRLGRQLAPPACRLAAAWWSKLQPSPQGKGRQRVVTSNIENIAHDTEETGVSPILKLTWRLLGIVPNSHCVCISPSSSTPEFPQQYTTRDLSGCFASCSCLHRSVPVSHRLLVVKICLKHPRCRLIFPVSGDIWCSAARTGHIPAIDGCSGCDRDTESHLDDLIGRWYHEEMGDR